MLRPCRDVSSRRSLSWHVFLQWPISGQSSEASSCQEAQCFARSALRACLNNSPCPDWTKSQFGGRRTIRCTWFLPSLLLVASANSVRNPDVIFALMSRNCGLLQEQSVRVESADAYHDVTEDVRVLGLSLHMCLCSFHWYCGFSKMVSFHWPLGSCIGFLSAVRIFFTWWTALCVFSNEVFQIEYLRGVLFLKPLLMSNRL